MADIKQKYGTAAQAITITLATLTSATARVSAAISNATNLFMDVKVQVQVKANAAGTSATGQVNVFAYGSADGSAYSGGVAGTDAAFSGDKDQLIFLGSIPMKTNSVVSIGMFNLSRAFGYGGIPASWGVVIDNQSGAALDATGTNHVVQYQGILAQAI